ncbi:iron transporter FeoA [bacterium]|nr:MAG: iron transporter FeoA [bacterium]
MLLSMLEPGDSGEIVDILGSGEIRQRLLDIGFLPGRIVSVIRYAPLGDPIEVEVMGTRVSLRLNEAALIKIRGGKGGGRRKRRRWLRFI